MDADTLPTTASGEEPKVTQKIAWWESFKLWIIPVVACAIWLVLPISYSVVSNHDYDLFVMWHGTYAMIAIGVGNTIFDLVIPMPHWTIQAAAYLVLGGIDVACLKILGAVYTGYFRFTSSAVVLVVAFFYYIYMGVWAFAVFKSLKAREKTEETRAQQELLDSQSTMIPVPSLARGPGSHHSRYGPKSNNHNSSNNNSNSNSNNNPWGFMEYSTATSDDEDFSEEYRAASRQSHRITPVGTSFAGPESAGVERKSTISSTASKEKEKDVEQQQQQQQDGSSKSKPGIPMQPKASKHVRLHSSTILPNFVRIFFLTAMILVAFYYCQAFAELFENQKSNGGAQIALIVAFLVPLVVVQIVMKSLAVSIDKAESVRGRTLFLAVLVAEVFIQVYQKFLFVVVRELKTFLIIQALYLAKDIFLYPVRMSHIYTKTLARLGSIVRNKPMISDTELQAAVNHSRLDLSLEFYLVALAQRISVSILAFAAWFLRSGYNKPYFKFQALTPHQAFQVMRFILYIFVIEFGSSVALHFIMLKAFRLDAVKVGVRAMRNSRCFWATVVVITHILTDAFLALHNHQFEQWK